MVDTSLNERVTGMSGAARSPSCVVRLWSCLHFILTFDAIDVDGKENFPTLESTQDHCKLIVTTVSTISLENGCFFS